jgi:nucleoside phosphorylase
MITALKPEAQAFVDFYKLKKSKLGDFTLFSHDNMKLIISGLGVSNARNATQTLINYFDIIDDDIYINVGICGANKSYQIGELIEIGAIKYDALSYTFKENKAVITCLDIEANKELAKIVDMESFGVYDAVIHSPAIQNFYIFKVVSDHFEPHLVTKDATKSLVFNAINEINTIIQN